MFFPFASNVSVELESGLLYISELPPFSRKGDNCDIILSTVLYWVYYPVIAACTIFNIQCFILNIHVCFYCIASDVLNGIAFFSPQRFIAEGESKVLLFRRGRHQQVLRSGQFL